MNFKNVIDVSWKPVEESATSVENFNNISKKSVQSKRIAVAVLCVLIGIILIAISTIHMYGMGGFQNDSAMYGTSVTNLVGGGYVTENEDYVFFIEEYVDSGTSSSNLTSSGIRLYRITDSLVRQYSKLDGTLRDYSARVRGLNVYNKNLYYYDYAQKDICKCDIGENFGENVQSLGILSANDSFSKLLIVNNKIVLLCSSPAKALILDLNSLENLTVLYNFYDFCYKGNTVYLLSDKNLLAVNLNTLETVSYDTPVSLYGMFVADGYIYMMENISYDWADKYGQSIYVYDEELQLITKTGIFISGRADMAIGKDNLVLLNKYVKGSTITCKVVDKMQIQLDKTVTSFSYRFFALDYNSSIPALGWKEKSSIGFWGNNGEYICLTL